MTIDELETAWYKIKAPSTPGAISGTRAGGLPVERPVYLSLDGKARRHLLVKVPDTTEPIRNIVTRGLDVKMDRFQVGSNPESMFIDLACLDQAQHPTFNSLVQDIILALRGTDLTQRDTVLNALTRWKVFWSDNLNGMSREDALGLFGELWFLIRWLAPIDRIAIERWQATQNARHDYQSPAASVEVKTACSSNAGAPAHHISGLEQLDDPESGLLYLFSLQVCEDRLSSNTLHSLVNRIASDLQNDYSGLTLLNEKLAARSYSPADRNYSTRSFRILAERMYQVRDGFPRITRNSFPGGLPDGIENLKYSINLSACDQWLVASCPKEINADIFK